MTTRRSPVHARFPRGTGRLLELNGACTGMHILCLYRNSFARVNRNCAFISLLFSAAYRAPARDLGVTAISPLFILCHFEGFSDILWESFLPDMHLADFNGWHPRSGGFRRRMATTTSAAKAAPILQP